MKSNFATMPDLPQNLLSWIAIYASFVWWEIRSWACILFFYSRIIRAPDRDLFHHFHDKKCDPNLTKEQYRSCLGSKAVAEGTHTQIAIQLTKLREKYELDTQEDGFWDWKWTCGTTACESWIVEHVRKPFKCKVATTNNETTWRKFKSWTLRLIIDVKHQLTLGFCGLHTFATVLLK